MWGYDRLLEARNDAERVRREERLEWQERGFDPDDMGEGAIRARLAQVAAYFR